MLTVWKLFCANTFVPHIKCKSCIHTSTTVTSMQLLHFTHGTVQIWQHESFQTVNIQYYSGMYATPTLTCGTNMIGNNYKRDWKEPAHNGRRKIAQNNTEVDAKRARGRPKKNWMEGIKNLIECIPMCWQFVY
jgi:hypothetical protein